MAGRELWLLAFSLSLLLSTTIPQVATSWLGPGPVPEPLPTCPPPPIPHILHCMHWGTPIPICPPPPIPPTLHCMQVPQRVPMSDKGVGIGSQSGEVEGMTLAPLLAEPAV